MVPTSPHYKLDIAKRGENEKPHPSSVTGRMGIWPLVLHVSFYFVAGT